MGALASEKSDKNILSNKATGKSSHNKPSAFFLAGSADSNKLDRLSNMSSQGDFALFPGGDEDLAKDCGIFNIELSKKEKTPPLS